MVKKPSGLGDVFFKKKNMQRFHDNHHQKRRFIHSVDAESRKDFEPALLFVTNLGIQSPFPCTLARKLALSAVLRV